MSLLLDALQRASQEKAGGNSRPTTGPETPSRPPSDTPLQTLQISDAHANDHDRRSPPKQGAAASWAFHVQPEKPAHASSLDPTPQAAPHHDTLAHDDALQWPDLIEPQPEEPANGSLTTSSLELLQEPEPLASTPVEPVSIAPPATPALQAPALQPPSVQPDPPVVPAPAHPDIPTPPPSAATPDLAHTLLNAGKAASPRSPLSRKRAMMLGALAVLILGVGMAMYFFVDLEALFMPSNTLSVARPAASPQTSPPISAAPSAPITEDHPQQSSIPETTKEPPIPAPTQARSPVAPHTAHAAHTVHATRPAAPSSSSSSTRSTAKNTAQPTDPAPSASRTPQTATAPSSPPGIARRTAEPDEIHQAYNAMTQGRLDEARSAYQRVLQTQPEDRDALLGLAYIAQNQERSDEARELYRRVLRQAPDNATANAGLLALMANNGASDTRISGLARDLTERHPRSATAYATLGDLMVREGRLADAQQAYFKAVALEAENARYAYNLAIALDRLHKPEQALSYYEHALALATKTTTPNQIPQDIIRQRIAQLRASLAAPSNIEAAGAP